MSSVALPVENFSRPRLLQKQGKKTTFHADMPDLLVHDSQHSVYCHRTPTSEVITSTSDHLNSAGSRKETASARAPKPHSIESYHRESFDSPDEPTLEDILNMYERGFTKDENKWCVRQ